MDSSTLVGQMKALGIWPKDDAAERAAGELCRKNSDNVRGFTRELLQRGVLTAYQANCLLTGKGTQLLIGPYIVMERLGAGGMGQVFKARHRHIERTVALKVIRPDRVTNRVAVTRFFREVRAAAQLNDPNIVRAFDADAANGTYYFAMEYVQGTDLSAYIKSRGPLPIEHACQLLAQAALGLQHIHEHGMVHRDIKPGNLMLALEETPARVGSAGVAMRTTPVVLKILDLGLARLSEDSISGEDGSKLGLTHEGTVMGTADYMAPEQARNCHDADIRCDIYSLGCAFYFALAGHAPFPGGTQVEKMLRHQLAEPAPLERFHPHVPPLFATILNKMMAKNPENRYQAPAEVVAALTPLLTTETGTPPLAIPLLQSEEQTISDISSSMTSEERRPFAVPFQMPARPLPMRKTTLFAAIGLCCFLALVLLSAVMLLALMH